MIDRAGLERLAADEPRSTPALAAALDVVPPWRARLVDVGPSSWCAFVHPRGGGRLAFPRLCDPSDAAAMAACIDRSSAVAVDGSARDVGPLLEHLERPYEAHRFRRMVVPASDEYEWAPPDPATRMATVLDLDALVELFEDYEIVFGRTPRDRRRQLADSIRRLRVIVATGTGGDVVAAMVALGVTPGYIVWSHGRVHPDARGTGRSWALVSRAAAIYRATGLGAISTLSDSNPMTLPEGVGTIDEQLSLNLSLPDRFPGEREVRRSLWRARRSLQR